MKAIAVRGRRIFGFVDTNGVRHREQKSDAESTNAPQAGHSGMARIVAATEHVVVGLTLTMSVESTPQNLRPDIVSNWRALPRVSLFREESRVCALRDQR